MQAGMVTGGRASTRAGGWLSERSTAAARVPARVPAAPRVCSRRQAWRASWRSSCARCWSRRARAGWRATSARASGWPCARSSPTSRRTSARTRSGCAARAPTSARTRRAPPGSRPHASPPQRPRGDGHSAGAGAWAWPGRPQPSPGRCVFHGAHRAAAARRARQLDPEPGPTLPTRAGAHLQRCARRGAGGAGGGRLAVHAGGRLRRVRDGGRDAAGARARAPGGARARPQGFQPVCVVCPCALLEGGSCVGRKLCASGVRRQPVRRKRSQIGTCLPLSSLFFHFVQLSTAVRQAAPVRP